MNFSEAYDICLKKAHIHIEKMRGEVCELNACTDGDYYAHPMGLPLGSFWSWTPSFVTGLAPIAYMTHHVGEFLIWANSFATKYRSKVFDTPLKSMHDLGFIYLPYSVALWKLTGDGCHRETAVKAADELVKRFSINGRYIEAWSEMDKPQKSCRAIVDTMMNIPLLLWAWKETGHTFYHDVACACIDTVLKNYLREDGSVCHAFIFDDETGEIKEEANTCGFSNGSHWARGTGWFVYGMAIAYEYTGDKRYLDAAEKAGHKFVDCLTEEDKIPVWDFRLPKEKPAHSFRPAGEDPFWDESKEENKKLNRDSSAAAVMVCAFQLLYRQTKDAFYKSSYTELLQTLCDSYLDTDKNLPGMLKCTNGRMEYSTYGDYYFMQALAYELYRIDICWYN